MADLLMPLLGWLLSGPVAGVLSTTWGAVIVTPVLCLSAVAAGAGLGAVSARLGAVRTWFPGVTR